MTREEVENIWRNFKCPVCGGTMEKERKQYSLVTPELFSRHTGPDQTLEAHPYICSTCGCTILRKP